MSEDHELSKESPTLHGIDVKITRLTGLLENHINTTKERQDRLQASNERHSKEIYGEGSDNSPGIKLKLDRLDQKEKMRSVLIGTGVASAVGLVLKTLWSLATTGKP